MLKTMLRRIAGAFVAAASLAFLPQAAEAKGAPALWSVSDADTTVYLFGTIHLLPDKYSWRTARFDQAVAGSNELVLETIIDDKDPMKLIGILTRLGFSNNLPPIATRVPPAKVPALEAAIAKSGVPRSAFDRMETWTAAFMLLGNQFKDLGLKGDQGVETALRSSFTSAGKPIGELETNSEQLGFFDTLPESAQRALLEGAIEDRANMRETFQADARRLVARRRSRDRAKLQPRPCRLARAQDRAPQSPQRQLEPLDRAAHGQARVGSDRRRRRSPGGQRIRCSSCSNAKATRSNASNDPAAAVCC